MNKDSLAIVTAVTPDYMKKLKWTLPTWTMKPQFKDCRLYIFHSGFKNIEKEFKWIEKYFSDIHLVEWSMEGVTNQRELMLSSFVLCSARNVEEDYFVKLDADTYFTDAQDAFNQEDFDYSICAHPWGYTKPGWWIDKLKAWVDNKSFDSKGKDGSTSSQKRIISWCCLHKTKFVKQASDVAGVRLPVPSHDTYLWFLANHFEDCNFKRVNLKKRGVDHCSRWKSIRENVCTHYLNNCNKYLDDTLLNNIQIEVTSRCNRDCCNCDRNCSKYQAKTNDEMSLKQIDKFVEEVLSNGVKFNRIDIIGGEPCLHKDILHICRRLVRLNNKIRLTTNGDHPEVLKQIEELYPQIEIRNSQKEKQSNNFEAVNIAPIDEEVTELKVCSIPWRCGIALTKYGYFSCGAGASIARVFGLDGVGFLKLKHANAQNLKKQMKSLCQLCGHSNSIKTKAPNKQTSSPRWKEAFKKYKECKPILREY